jgi:hypothetical protein
MAQQNVIQWRTCFCGAWGTMCATETLILWRTGPCATETLFLWRCFCGAPPMRHKITFLCATDEAFPTSAFVDHFGGEVSSSFQIYTEIYFNVKWAMVKLFFSGLIDGMVKI